MQHVGQRHQTHALVVGHQGGNRYIWLQAGAPGGGKVQRLDKSVASAGTEFLQRGKVQRRRVGCQLRRQRGGIGCDHQFVRWGAAQRQIGHTLRGVLVGQRVVTGGIGRLRHPPRHPE